MPTRMHTDLQPGYGSIFTQTKRGGVQNRMKTFLKQYDDDVNNVSLSIIPVYTIVTCSIILDWFKVLLNGYCSIYF